MPLLQLSQVSLAYGHVPLLDHVDLVVEPGERIGLIGRNGTGKSSLLKIIEGLAAPDDGKVWRAPQLKLASVPQEPAFLPGQSVFDAVAEGLGAGTKLLVDYHAATHALAEHGNHDDVGADGTGAASAGGARRERRLEPPAQDRDDAEPPAAAPRTIQSRTSRAG